MAEPILITATGTIISGFRAWQAALSDLSVTVDCIEYPLSDEEALEYIVGQHRLVSCLNSFVRIRLALELEPHFQARAGANQRHGGQFKGSANLPKAEHIDVREEVARIAGVSSRSVSNVKTILKNAAPEMIVALQGSTIRINRALQWCTLPRWKQIEQFTRYHVARACDKVIRNAVGRPTMEAISNLGAVLELLRLQEAQEPGSVVIRISTRRQTIITLGQDLLCRPWLETQPSST